MPGICGPRCGCTALSGLGDGVGDLHAAGVGVVVGCVVGCQLVVDAATEVVIVDWWPCGRGAISSWS